MFTSRFIHQVTPVSVCLQHVHHYVMYQLGVTTRLNVVQVCKQSQ